MCFDAPTFVVSFTQSNKTPLIACRPKAQLQRVSIDHTKVVYLKWSRQKYLIKNGIDVDMAVFDIEM